MKVKVTKEIEVEDTKTEGKHEYLVALRCGGLMESPEVYYEDYQVIRADNEQEAREKYNKINNCSYFYGHVIEQLS